MQETLLRRYRCDGSAVGQQNGLAQLQVPVPQRQFLPFERGQREIGAPQVFGNGFWVGRSYAGSRLADHARSRPRLPVERGHPTREHLDETTLQLIGAPLVKRRVPALGNEAGGASDRPRFPRPIREIGCKHFAFVGRDEHVVIGRAL
jgi:hypothetical protein